MYVGTNFIKREKQAEFFTYEVLYQCYLPTSIGTYLPSLLPTILHLFTYEVFYQCYLPSSIGTDTYTFIFLPMKAEVFFWSLPNLQLVCSSLWHRLPLPLCLRSLRVWLKLTKSFNFEVTTTTTTRSLSIKVCCNISHVLQWLFFVC